MPEGPASPRETTPKGPTPEGLTNFVPKGPPSTRETTPEGPTPEGLTEQRACRAKTTLNGA